jgi:hypothetical protein
MAALRSVALVAVAAAACAGRPISGPGARKVAGDEITLYRDAAVIRQRVEIDVGDKPATLEVTLAAGVTADQIIIIDRGALTVEALRAGPGASEELANDANTPVPIRITVRAPRPGRHALVVGYITDRVRWDAAYTLTTTPSREQATLRGALAIRNATGVVLRAAATRVIDAELVPWRHKTAEHLAAALVGGTAGSTLPAAARELGSLELGSGETRIELIKGERRIRSVLVYDPIGTALDNPVSTPLRDPALGTRPRATSRVTESFEVARDPQAMAGLPAGPVRMLERERDGSLAVLGEARLFDAATRVADVDTVAVGVAENVSGARERRELSVDEHNRRLVEEFAITLDNRRDVAVEILVREHLYRGQNWTLSYHSADDAKKDGPQQVTLRTQVPARTRTKIVYVVVYTLGP